MHFLQAERIEEGVIVPKPGTHLAFSGFRAYVWIMRYRKNLCLTVNPLTLAAFDEMILDEAHSKRLRSRVIEDMMRSLIAAWNKEKQSRANLREAMNQVFSYDPAGDLIAPPENRDAPDNQASGILDGTNPPRES
jgi:hypothetical protein